MFGFHINQDTFCDKNCWKAAEEQWTIILGFIMNIFR